jgi:hypothetical protein
LHDAERGVLPRPHTRPQKRGFDGRSRYAPAHPCAATVPGACRVPGGFVGLRLMPSGRPNRAGCLPWRRDFISRKPLSRLTFGF